MAAEKEIGLAELATMADGVRSLSGVTRLVGLLSARGAFFTNGEEAVELIDRLIRDLYYYAGAHPGAPDEVPDDLEERELRLLTTLTLLRSGQNGIGGLDMVAAERDARRGLLLARHLEERSMITQALSHLGNTLLACQKPEEAANAFSEEVYLGRQDAPTRGLVRSLYNLARANIGRGYREGAREAVREGLDLYDDQESGEGLPLFGKALLLQIWQDLHEDEHNPEVTLSIARESIEILEQLDLPERLIPLRLGVIRLHLLRNDLKGCVEELLAIKEILREDMSPFLQCQHLVAVTAVNTALNNLDKAEESAIEGLVMARSMGNRIAESILLERLTAITQVRGRPESALIHSDAALKIEHHPVRRSHLLRLRADIFLDLGRLEEAREALEEGRKTLRSSHREADRGYFDYTEGRYAIETGDLQGGIERLKRIREYPLAAHAMVTASHRLLSEAYEREGRNADGLAEFKAYHKMVMRREEARVEGEIALIRAERGERSAREGAKKREVTRGRAGRVRGVGRERLIIAIMERLDRLNTIEESGQRRLEIDKISRMLREVLSDKSRSLLDHIQDLDTSFIDRLTEDSTSLTPGQTRLTLLIRSGLTSREIATLLNISSNTLTMQRKRLRKRLGLQKGESLEEKIRKA